MFSPKTLGNIISHRSFFNVKTELSIRTKNTWEEIGTSHLFRFPFLCSICVIARLLAFVNGEC